MFEKPFKLNLFIGLLLLVLTIFSTLSRANSLDPVRKGANKFGAAVVVFSVKDYEKFFVKNYGSRVLSFYDNQLEVVAPKNFYADPFEGQDWAIQNFKNRFEDLLKKSNAVDLYIFGHSNVSYSFLLRDVSADLRKKIRLVYNMGCGEGTTSILNQWRAFGAKAAVGHPKEVSYSPVFMTAFIGYWLMGYDLNTSVTMANEAVIGSITVILTNSTHNTIANWVGQHNLTIYTPLDADWIV
jgi:hypothetical protein